MKLEAPHSKRISHSQQPFSSPTFWLQECFFSSFFSPFTIKLCLKEVLCCPLFVFFYFFLPCACLSESCGTCGDGGGGGRRGGGVSGDLFIRITRPYAKPAKQRSKKVTTAASLSLLCEEEATPHLQQRQRAGTNITSGWGAMLPERSNMSADGAMLLLEGYLQKRKDTMVRFWNGLGGVRLRSLRTRPCLSLLADAVVSSFDRRWDGWPTGSGSITQPCSSTRKRTAALWVHTWPGNFCCSVCLLVWLRPQSRFIIIITF